MDAKSPLLPRTAQTETQAPRQHSRFKLIALPFLLILCWVFRPRAFLDDGEKKAAKVPLEVHIMSKCPDTRDCLQKLVLPAMANVSDKVDFRISYIGKATSTSDDVTCLHGQTECLGNILELCAASVYPSPLRYLGFTMCLSRSYKEIPAKDLVQDCALEHGLDFEKLNDCMSQDDGAYGMGMLRDSVLRSERLNATTSCTVRLNEEVRCVVDGGVFRECEGGSKPEDLVRDIERLYGKKNSWWG